MNLDRRYSFLIVAACFLWAVDLLVRYPLTLKMDFVSIVFVESIVGLLFVSPWILKNIKLLKSVTKAEWAIATFIGGVGMCLAGYLQTTCIQKATPGLFSFFQIFQPLFVIYLAHVLLKEKVDNMYLYWGIWVVLSAILMFSVDLQLMFSSSDFVLGDILIALSTMMIWGLCTIASKVFLKRHSPLLLVALRWFFAFVFSSVILFAEKKVLPMDVILRSENILAFAFIGAIAGVFSMYLYYQGLKFLAVGKVSFLEISYAAFGMILSSIYTFEGLTFFQLLGGFSFFVFIFIFLTRQESNLSVTAS